MAWIHCGFHRSSLTPVKNQERISCAYDRRLSAPPVMLVGEVYLETISSGIITQEEIDWLTTHQGNFSREEEAMALKLGRLLDEGRIQIGCRLIDTPPEPGAYGPPEEAPTA